MNRISSAIRNIIGKGTVVVAGVSGGPDSICMLHALVNAREELGLIIVPVHINHKFREAADAEQLHIEEVCREMGLECSSFVIDCRSMARERRISEEEAGRIARYDAFNRVAVRLGEQYPEAHVVIAVAHNADDQSETVMHRIIRGTGLRGLAGMRTVSTDEGGCTVVRPLLGISRAEIERYVADNKLVPNMDESNETTDYTRNRIRLELLPYIEEHFNPEVSKALRTLADIAAEDDDYMRQAAESAYRDAVMSEDEGARLVLNGEKAADMHTAVLRRVISMMLGNIGLDSEISYSLISGVEDVLKSDNPSAMINLPGGFAGMREYGKLILARIEVDEEKPSEAVELKVSVIDSSEYEKPAGRMYAAFDYDKFCIVHSGKIEDILLRTRQPGDAIAIRGGGHKKLQNIFVDSKVPARCRDQVYFAAVGAEILWIPSTTIQNGSGDRIMAKYSHNYQMDDSTERVLFLELVKKIW